MSISSYPGSTVSDPTVLIIDDHDSMREGMAVTLKKSGHDVAAVRSGLEGVAAYQKSCRAATSLPLGLGFGIKTAADVRELRGLADIAIVGTAGTEERENCGPDGYWRFLKALAAETA